MSAAGEELFVMLLWTLVWIVIGRWIAKRKGRWTIGMGVWLFLLGPIVILILLFLKKDQDILDDEMVRDGKRKRCPYCASIINTEAILCSFCGSDLRRREQEGDDVGEEEPEQEGDDVGKEEPVQKADILYSVYGLTVLSIEWFVYDWVHIDAVKGPILDFLLG